jgi:hypothetical protein
MANQYRGGLLTPTGVGTDRLARIGDDAARDYQRAMDAPRDPCGVAAAYRIVDATNEYIASNAPWALAKDPSKADALSQVLYDSAEALRLDSRPPLAGHAGLVERDPAPRRAHGRKSLASIAMDAGAPRESASSFRTCRSGPVSIARVRRRKLCLRPSRQHQPRPRRPPRLPRQRHPPPPHHLRWPRPPPTGVFRSINSWASNCVRQRSSRPRTFRSRRSC